MSLRVVPNQIHQRINLLPPHGKTLQGMLGSVFALGMALFIASDTGAAFTPEHIFIAVLTLAGIGGIAWSGNILLSKREAVFGQDGVEVVGHSLLGREKWWAAYNSFKGVLHREHEEHRGKNQSSITYQLIELLHDEPGKTLPLLVERSVTMPRDPWELYAKWLSLPAMTKSGGELTVRAHEDLDKSVRELVTEGKIEALPENAAAPPPKGLQVVKESSEDGDRLRVTIMVARTPIWIKAGILAFAIVFLGVIGAAFLPDLILVVPASIFGLGALLILRSEWRERHDPRQILISRTQLTVIDSWLRRPAKEMTFELDEIETIEIGSTKSGKGITLASDRTQVDIGYRLSQTALVWLKDYLTAAVATA